MSELIVLESLNPIEVFTNNGLDKIIDKIEADIKSIVTDATTKKGRDEIASLAYKVARSKTTLDDMGKALTEDWKKKSAAVDAERKRMRERMDKIKDDVRKPLTDFENSEQERVNILKGRLQQIRELMVLNDNSQDELQKRLAQVNGIDLSDWQEFTDMATAAKNEAIELLSNELIKRIKYDQDQAELARLREEAAQREQQERDARIADEAAEKARQEAEAKAAAEQQRLLDEKATTEREIARLQQERLDAEKRAVEAEQRERDRQAELKRQEAEEQERLARDRDHKIMVHNKILKGMAVAGRIDGEHDEEYKSIIKAIAKGEIPNLKIIY